MPSDPTPAEIAARLSPAQRQMLAHSVAELVRLSIGFAGDGICLSSDDADDPAKHLCDMTDALGLVDWDQHPAIIKALFEGGT